ncbi:hypothetical protein AB4379_12140 [Vibrio breoganii]
MTIKEAHQSQGYIAMPYSVLDLRMGMVDKLVLSFFINSQEFYEQKIGEFKPAIGYAAKRLRISNAEYRESVKRLTSRGYISFDDWVIKVQEF